ncbi:MAG: ABC transporter substrate-binding protein [Acetobacteraceae bacterium]|nr:ABC transporter substrate-binding protein [Acetobacteraceae bacterium]MBV8590239.1 ABC transporter substrate-binding protein [Acetobacteraceae bacterium]
MSGPYAGYQGRGAVVAAQLAVEHFGRKVRGRAIEVIAGDHQNKPDVGSALARWWLDLDDVKAIFDVPNSAVTPPCLRSCAIRQRLGALRMGAPLLMR